MRDLHIRTTVHCLFIGGMLYFFMYRLRSRTQSFYFSGLVGGTCRCGSSLASLGTRTGSPVNGACSNGADTNVLLTGIGKVVLCKL